MKKLFATLLVAVICAFFGTAHANSMGTYYTVDRGDTLTSIGKKSLYSARALCKANPQIAARKSCNDLRVGDRIHYPGFGKKVQPTNVNGEIPYAVVGRAPLRQCGKKDVATINNESWTVFRLSQEDRSWLLLNIDHRGPRMDITPEEGLVRILPGIRLEQVTFCRDGKVVATGPMRTAWSADESVYGQLFVLPSGRVLVWMWNCLNWITWTPPAKVVTLIPAKLPKEELPPPAPVVELPPPADEPELIPFHITKETVEKPRCEVQAGTGIYGNNVYQGAWAYGENICYVWQNGEWQAGPGLYAMYGSGHSLASDYRGKEVGVGLQAGIQRNWINDRNNRASADLKIRWLSDRSWGSNPESGYAFTQKGQKFGLYAGYAESLRHDKPFATEESDLVGVTVEYWKSFGATVDSTWAQQPVQDRGSVGVAGFYETKLSQDNKWRQRIIGGVAHTNWDQQNWLKGTYEIRYDEWLMFGPQITLPIGVSDLNQPMSTRDLTTIGAFIRAEFGGKAREADANSKDEQLEFNPAK